MIDLTNRSRINTCIKDIRYRINKIDEENAFNDAPMQERIEYELKQLAATLENIEIINNKPKPKEA